MDNLSVEVGRKETVNKNFGKKLLIGLKEFFWTKGAIIWKLPLYVFIWTNVAGIFFKLFSGIMLAFTVTRSDGQFFNEQMLGKYASLILNDPTADVLGGYYSGIFQENYANIFAKCFDSFGIKFICYEIFALLLVMLFAFIVDRFSTEEMGIKISIKSVFLFIGGVLVAFTLVSSIDLFLFLNGNLKLEGLTWKVNPSLKNISYLIIFQGVLYVLVAFQEEMLSRGYLINNLKWLKDKGIKGVVLTIFICSAIFSIFHISNLNSIGFSDMVGLLNIGLLAVLFCVYFIRYNDLWLLIGAHFGWNFFMGPFYGTTVSNVESFKGKSIFKVTMTGADYLTGGGFGPEGSLVTSFLLFIILLGVILIARRKVLKTRKILSKT